MTDADKLARYDDLANLVEDLHDENMELRQQLAAMTAERDDYASGIAMGMKREHGLREQVTMLRKLLDKMVFLFSKPWCSGDHISRVQTIEESKAALAATEPKP